MKYLHSFIFCVAFAHAAEFRVATFNADVSLLNEYDFDAAGSSVRAFLDVHL